METVPLLSMPAPPLLPLPPAALMVPPEMERLPLRMSLPLRMPLPPVPLSASPPTACTVVPPLMVSPP